MRLKDLRPHLEALAYLMEIIYAEGLFLRYFEKREHSRLRRGISMVVILLLGALVMRRLLADSEKQYEQSKASAEQINVAVHDIRYMLARDVGQ